MADVYCRNCGKQISDLAAVCVGCGVATGNGRVQNSQVSGGTQAKSSGLAVLFTILWPGAGHLYIGRTQKGTPYVIANAIAAFLSLTVVLLPVGFIIWLVTLLMTAPNIANETEEVNSLAGF